MSAARGGPRTEATHDRSDRLPDFVIIGAMKSATSTLVPVAPRATRRPHGVAEGDELLRRSRSRGTGASTGIGTFFADAAEGQLTGEASVIYTSPEYADVAAERMAAAVPQARLIYIVREPIARLRSHYRHEASASPRNAIACWSASPSRGTPTSATACTTRGSSRTCGHFPREQILVASLRRLRRGAATRRGPRRSGSSASRSSPRPARRTRDRRGQDPVDEDAPVDARARRVHVRAGGEASEADPEVRQARVHARRRHLQGRSSTSPTA